MKRMISMMNFSADKDDLKICNKWFGMYHAANMNSDLTPSG